MDLDRLDQIAAACGPAVYGTIATLLPNVPAALLAEVANAAVAGVRLALYARAQHLEAGQIRVIDLREDGKL